MKKAILSVFATVGLLLLPFAGAGAAVTGTFTAVITTPNSAGATITFPDFSGGVTGTAGTQATGSFTVSASSTTGSTTSIRVGGTELLGSSVDFTTDAAGTAAALAAAINANASTSGYTAMSSGATVTVTAPSGSGTAQNGLDFTFTSSGDLAFTTTAFSGGADASGGVSASTTSSHFVAVATSSADTELNIGSTTISLTAGDTGAQTAAAVAAAINGNASAPYTASVTNTDEVTLTQKSAGTSGNVAVIASDLSYNGTAEVATFTPANVTAGETFRAVINGTPYDFTATSSSTVASVTAALSAEMNANPAVSCTASGTDIMCTATNPGTAFTASASVLPSGSIPFLFPVSIHSSNSNSACAKLGDTVTLTFTSSTALGASSTVMIEGQTVPITSLGGNMYSATLTLNGSSTPGIVTFLVSPFDNGNVAASSTASTTDNSSVAFNTTAPRITLNGSAQMNQQFTLPFTDPGATAVDNAGASTTVRMVGNVDVNTPGTYTLTYVASDCAGNTASTTRTVTVPAPGFSSGSSHSPNSTFPGGSSGSVTGVTVGGITVSAILLPPLTFGPSSPSIPLIPNTGVEFTGDISEGMSGSDVLSLQEKLFETGYLTVSPTGFFGPLTRSALMRLQAANGLSATGVFDAETQDFMSS